MKIEVGKYYKTRNGLKAYVESCNLFRGQEDLYPFNGTILSADEVLTYHGNVYWNKNGNVSIEKNVVYPNDLVEEWENAETLFNRLQNIAATLRELEKEIDKIISYCERGHEKI
jgi:hypothetical protein